MGKFQDFTGKRFGRWTVIKRAEDRKSKIYWLCKCDCGKKKEVREENLINGKSKSCGCSKREETSREKMIGRRFGNLMVLGEERSGEHKYWKCRCDCGNIKIASTSYLLNGTAKSCGHERCNPYRKDTPRNKSPLTASGKRKLCYLEHQRILQIRRSMIQRCECENNENYKWYGGKEIKICEEWRNDPLKFYDWAIESGYAENLTIDRIDPNGDYFPENCRWVTMKVQNRNKTNSILIEYNGDKKTLSEWCEILNLPRATIRHRIYKMNMDIKEAFTIPIKGKA